jgi:hypothetical protein
VKWKPNTFIVIQKNNMAQVFNKESKNDSWIDIFQCENDIISMMKSSAIIEILIMNLAYLVVRESKVNLWIS